MTKLRALIVDDEPLARERLRSLLASAPTVEIVGECSNGRDAIDAIRSTPSEVVFLDMQMPGCDGLQVLKEIPAENRPAIVFATAHERFALDAFEVQAVDYLLKRTRRIGNLEEKLESLLGESGGGPKKNERFAVKADGRLVFLKPDDIVWAEAADNYVVLHLVSGQLMVRETMVALEARLGSGSFARVNRSAIVHLDQIKELQPTFHGDYLVLLRDGTKLPLSRNLRSHLDKLTGQKLG
jgi:two-component system, LytTR family, response regulator